jgi:anti-sigma regulatory factor (Ser/Thr protein kinase)
MGMNEPAPAGDALDWLHEQGKRRSQAVPELEVEETLRKVRAASEVHALGQDHSRADAGSSSDSDEENGARGPSRPSRRVVKKADSSGMVRPRQPSGVLVAVMERSEVLAVAERNARAAGLPEERVVDFVIAVNEVTADVVRHAKTQGSIEIWSDTDEIICEVRDGGVTASSLASSPPPLPNAAGGGHGLWLVHQLCDRVEQYSDENGSVIRIYMSL